MIYGEYRILSVQPANVANFAVKLGLLHGTKMADDSTPLGFTDQG